MLWGESCPHQRVVSHLWDSNPPGEALQPIAVWKFNFIYFTQFSSEWSSHRHEPTTDENSVAQPTSLTTTDHMWPRQPTTTGFIAWSVPRTSFTCSFGVCSPKEHFFVVCSYGERVQKALYGVKNRQGKLSLVSTLQQAQNSPCLCHLRHPDTNTTAMREGRPWQQRTGQRSQGVSSPIVCCLCLSGLLLPWRDKWTPAPESSDTIHKDVFEQQNNYLLSQAVGETESGSFESLHWKENPFLGPWQPFLFCQCKKNLKKTELKHSFFFITLDLADHVFPLLEKDSKEDQIYF